MKITVTSIGDIVTGTVNITVVCFLQLKLKETLNCFLALVIIFFPIQFTDPRNPVHGLFSNQWMPGQEPLL